jgi:hypothetical protein
LEKVKVSGRFVVPVSPGRILKEAEGGPYEVAKEASDLGAQNDSHYYQIRCRRDKCRYKYFLRDENFRIKELSTPFC